MSVPRAWMVEALPRELLFESGEGYQYRVKEIRAFLSTEIVWVAARADDRHRISWGRMEPQLMGTYRGSTGRVRRESLV